MSVGVSESVERGVLDTDGVGVLLGVLEALRPDERVVVGDPVSVTLDEGVIEGDAVTGGVAVLD